MAQGSISVLHFSSALVRYGAEEHMLTLLRGLPRKYFQLSAVCRPELIQQFGRDMPDDVDVVPLRAPRPLACFGLRHLARILRERHVEVLHSHMFHSSRIASPVGWACRVPVVIETPHVAENWRRGWLKSNFFIDRWVGRSVDFFIAVSHANARYLIEQKRLPGEKVVVIRNGCELGKFDPSLPQPPGLREALGFQHDDPVLVLPGRLEPQKGHGVLLDALVLVRHEFPRARAVFVGDGSLRAELVQRTVALDLEESVRFAGFQSHIAEWFALSALTVLPSFYEGLPLAAVESLAAGRPVVATAVDGSPEVIVHGLTGLTVPPGDPYRLAEAICILLRSPELRKRFGEQGRKWVEQHFNQEAQVRETGELYLWAWERSARRGRVHERRFSERPNRHSTAVCWPGDQADRRYAHPRLSRSQP